MRKLYKPEGALYLVGYEQITIPLQYPLELPTLHCQTYEKLINKTLTFDFKEAKLSEMLDVVSTSLDLKVRLSSDIRDEVFAKKISFKVSSLSAYNALKVLMSQYGLGLEIDDQGGIYIAERGQGFHPDPRILALSTLEQARHGGLRDDRELEDFERYVQSSFSQMHMTLEFADQPLRDVVEFVRQFTNCSFVIDADVGQTKKVTYRGQNVPLSQALKDILGPEYDFVFDRVLTICSSDRAKSIIEKKRNDRARRDQILSRTVTVQGSSPTAVLDRLRRFDGLPIIPDREVWEKGKGVTIDTDGVPLQDFLDRAVAKLGAKWAYCEGTIYVYMPSQKQ